MFCHDFRLPFAKLRAGYRKSRQNGFCFIFLPRVNTRGYKYYAPNGAYNHAAVWQLATMNASCVYNIVYPVE